MSFERLRKPIIGVTLAATTVLGVSCGENQQPDPGVSAPPEAEACMRNYSTEEYRQNVIDMFGEENTEFVGRITLSACAGYESCSEETTPTQVLRRMVANEGIYADEAASILADPSNGGLAEVDNLRECGLKVSTNPDNFGQLVPTGEMPEFFLSQD